MKRLILMRHAKSDWSAGLRDIERPLNKRGHKAAAAVGDWLRDNDLTPDEILCSVATRTVQTLAGLALPDTPGKTISKALYLAEPDEMVVLLKQSAGACVLMIGHNPGSAMLARALVATPPDHAQFLRYPTGATLVVDFDIDNWTALEMHSGKVIDFVVPRGL